MTWKVFEQSWQALELGWEGSDLVWHGSELGWAALQVPNVTELHEIGAGWTALSGTLPTQLVGPEG